MFAYKIKYGILLYFNHYFISIFNTDNMRICIIAVIIVDLPNRIFSFKLKKKAKQIAKHQRYVQACHCYSFTWHP